MLPPKRQTLHHGRTNLGEHVTQKCPQKCFARCVAFLDFVVKVVRRMVGQQGIAPLPRRWIVERTFGWMMQWRRLVRDYEMRLDVSTALIHVALGSLLLQRLMTPQ